MIPEEGEDNPELAVVRGIAAQKSPLIIGLAGLFTAIGVILSAINWIEAKSTNLGSLETRISSLEETQKRREAENTARFVAQDREIEALKSNRVADIADRVRQKDIIDTNRRIDDLSNQVAAVDQRLSSQIGSVDQRLQRGQELNQSLLNQIIQGRDVALPQRGGR